VTIAYVILDASLGGHTRTAVTTARAVERLGHKVEFVIGNRAKPDVLEQNGVPYRVARFDQFSDLAKVLDGIPDLGAIHTFTTLGCAELAAYAARKGINLVYTRCGGPSTADFFDSRMMRALELPFVCCVSPENGEHFLASLGMSKDRIEVLPGRVEVDAVVAKNDPALQAKLFEAYGLDPSIPVVLRIARVGPAYETSITQGAAAVAEVNARGVPCQFVHIGHVNVEESFAKVRQAIDAANERAGRKIAATCQDEGRNAIAYNGLAKIAIGAGRSLLEACSLRKPTIVIGVNGYAGLVSPDESGPLAYYNFAGRNIAQHKPAEQSIGEIADVFQKLLTDPTYYEAMADYALDFTRREFDVDAAARRYAELYARGHEIHGGHPRKSAKALLFGKAKRIIRASVPRELILRITNRRQYGKDA